MSDTNIDERIEAALKSTHRVGSHSDDYGGTSDSPCYCTAKAQIKQLLVDEYKWLWNATQPDLVPSRTEPDEIGKLILERLAALQGK